MPGCDISYHHCQIHHINYWENGGRTDLDNMVPLCSRHHHAAHEGRWTLKLEPETRILTASPPRDGPGP
jgi:5-methylcytosine-specific restriction endonuclease McrA